MSIKDILAEFDPRPDPNLRHQVKQAGFGWCGYLGLPHSAKWYELQARSIEETTCHKCLEFMMAYGERAATRYAELEKDLGNTQM